MRGVVKSGGGQGCFKTVMANQEHDDGEPLKLDDASLRRIIALGEPFVGNWRHLSPVYEGRSTRWFHIWPTELGYGVFSTKGMLADYEDEDDALSVMNDLRTLYEKEMWDMAYKMKEIYAEARDTATCYFIGTGNGPVKIGVSGKVKNRLRELQSGSPYKLHILAEVEGGYVAERRYHKRFSEHRLEGEWFAPHPDILAEIERLTTKDTPHAS